MPGQWLRDLYNDLVKRTRAGGEYLERPDLDELTRRRANARFAQVLWQAHLIEQVAKEYTPCPTCPRTIGGTRQSEPPWLGEFAVWNFQQHFAEAAVVTQTPSGREVALVPWKSGAANRCELTPEDLATLARVGRLAGMDNELAVLDRLLDERGQPKGDSA